MEFDEAIITGKKQMTPSTGLFQLQLKDSTWDYKPGQHTVIKATIDGEEVMKPYTMTNLPGTNKFCLAIKEYQNGTMSVHMNKKDVDDDVTVSKPKGNLYIRNYNRDIVLVSTGTGATPMMAMLRDYLKQGSGTVYYFHGEKTRETKFFSETLNQLEAEHDNLETVYSYSEEPNEPNKYIQTYLPNALESFDKDFYVCGVPQMVVETKDILAEHTSPENIYSEGWEEDAT